MNKQFLGVKRQNQQASFEVSLMLSFKNGTFFLSGNLFYWSSEVLNKHASFIMNVSLFRGDDNICRHLKESFDMV